MSPRAAAAWLGATLLPPALLAGWLALRPGKATAPARALPVAAAESDCEVFEGELELPDGTRLSARLHPLHADAARQEFERVALAKRFGLTEPGGPWRLELWRSPGPLRTAAEGLEVQSPTAVDERGPCLTPLRPPVAATGAAPDPLATLLAGLEGDLPPGTQRSGIVWGRGPEGATRLLVGREIRLRARRLPVGELETAWARDRAPAEQH